MWFVVFGRVSEETYHDKLQSFGFAVKPMPPQILRGLPDRFKGRDAAFQPSAVFMFGRFSPCPPLEVNVRSCKDLKFRKGLLC